MRTLCHVCLETHCWTQHVARFTPAALVIPYGICSDAPCHLLPDAWPSVLVCCLRRLRRILPRWLERGDQVTAVVPAEDAALCVMLLSSVTNVQNGSRVWSSYCLLAPVHARSDTGPFHIDMHVSR